MFFTNVKCLKKKLYFSKVRIKSNDIRFRHDREEARISNNRSRVKKRTPDYFWLGPSSIFTTLWPSRRSPHFGQNVYYIPNNPEDCEVVSR